MRAWLTGNTVAATDFICRRVLIPNDIDLVMAVNGAISELAKAHNWEQYGSATPEETAALMLEMLERYYESDVCMIGTIIPFATVDPPDGCLLCDGTQYNRVDYPRLYDRLLPALQVSADAFSVPDLRDQFILGSGANHAPLSSGGAEEHALTVDQMPAHAHTTQPHTHSEISAISTLINGGVEAPASAAVPAPATTGVGTVVVDSAGGGQAHNNMPPFTALRYCIVAR